MTMTNRTGLRAALTPFASGALYLDRQLTHLDDATQWPAAIASGDQIQIGVVPAGCVLVPQLSSFQIPKVDSNGAATGKYKLGTASAITAIAAEQNGNAAVSLFGEDLALTGVVGSPTDDTPIYLTASAAVATVSATGTLVADLVLRAWRDDTDA